MWRPFERYQYGKLHEQSQDPNHLADYMHALGTNLQRTVLGWGAEEYHEFQTNTPAQPAQCQRDILFQYGVVEIRRRSHAVIVEQWTNGTYRKQVFEPAA